jgi:hypothetical protein
MTSVDTPLIWFQLVDSEGGPYKKTTASSVSLPPGSVIDQFRDAVKAKYSDSHLKGFAPSDLRVYKNKASFDKRKAIGGQEEPLDEDLPISGLGGSKQEALIVVVLETTSVYSDQRPFAEFLKSGRITRPDSQVISRVAKQFPNHMLAALRAGSNACVDLYETVKVLPSSFTRGVIQSDMKISINGPMSLAQPNILLAADLDTEKLLLIKLLRIPETTSSQSTLSKKDAVTAEIEACTNLTKENILGLVKCDVVEVTVHHSEGLNVSPGEWAAIKMDRYMSSLTETPQLSEKVLYRGFSRILKALKAMHALGLVHMDVKSDNVFVDVDLNWDLGDFGSTRKIGTQVWSYTKVLNPYAIPVKATQIPSMDYVLLCITIAVELKKDHWKDLCGQQQNVQERLILERLNSIQDVHFKREVVDLFEHNFKIVQEHFQNS